MRLKLPDAYAIGYFLGEEKTFIASFIVFGAIGLLCNALFGESQAGGVIESFFLLGMIGASIHLVLFIFVQRLDPRLRPPPTSGD